MITISKYEIRVIAIPPFLSQWACSMCDMMNLPGLRPWKFSRGRYAYTIFSLVLVENKLQLDRHAEGQARVRRGQSELKAYPFQKSLPAFSTHHPRLSGAPGNRLRVAMNTPNLATRWLRGREEPRKAFGCPRVRSRRWRWPYGRRRSSTLGRPRARRTGGLRPTIWQHPLKEERGCRPPPRRKRSRASAAKVARCRPLLVAVLAGATVALHHLPRCAPPSTCSTSPVTRGASVRKTTASAT